ncbi:MAG TPA: vanadium-dependent haloperoxidase [Vicinamibacterales bacterium]
MKNGVIASLVALIATLGWANTVRADEVTDWNETMLRSALIAGTSPVNMSRVTALVQSSVFDAVNGIDRRYSPIHVTPAATAGASRRAAAVQAAYVMLVKLYGTGGLFTTTQQALLDARRNVSLMVISADESSTSIASGIAWGQFVANEIWTWRLTDGFSLAPPSYAGSTAIGQWRPTPNAPSPGTSALGNGYPQFFSMTPWVMTSASQFLPGPPPAISSPRYLADYNEVKTMGSLTSTTRTADQTIYSLFWQSATSSYLWNRIALSIIEARNLDRADQSPGNDNLLLLENARILAEAGVAMADAAIGCYNAKYTYGFWRPITAIREDDGNPATVQDPTWTPLFTTPAHPDYPSNHSCISAAAGVILANEFGNNVPFTVDSDGMLGVTRSFRRVSDAVDEVKNARVYAGIHFRTATDVGQALGESVGRYVIEHAFLPVD